MRKRISHKKAQKTQKFRSAILCAFCAFLWLPPQNASIQGIVVKGSGGGPLSRAQVELRREGGDASVLDSTTTDDDGTFLFRNLQPGRYQISASRAGYARPPVTVTIQAGQPDSVIQLPMKPTSAIYGRIYDSRGRPLGNIRVQAMRASYPEGRRTLTIVQSVHTNDLGEYRLFWLAPGRYYIAAIPAGADSSMTSLIRSGGISQSVAIGSNRSMFSATAQLDPAIIPPDPGEPASQSETFVPVYFPSTTDEQAASPIDLGAGAEFGGANIVVTSVKTRHVRGLVLDGMTGRPAQYATMDVLDDNPRPLLAGPRDGSPINKDTGTFDIVSYAGSSHAEH
jgi:hypothetical protein